MKIAHGYIAILVLFLIYGNIERALLVGGVLEIALSSLLYVWLKARGAVSVPKVSFLYYLMKPNVPDGYVDQVTMFNIGALRGVILLMGGLVHPLIGVLSFFSATLVRRIEDDA